MEEPVPATRQDSHSMTPAQPQLPLRVALLSSGLGYTVRGIESWMIDLADHLPADIEAELWPGGPVQHPSRRVRRCASLNRNSHLLSPLSWDRRYYLEQASQIPSILWNVRKFQPHILYSGDPGLCHLLHRLRRWHRTRIVFMNGMRLTPRWIQCFDGVHLLAQGYLDEAQSLLGTEKSGHFFAIPHFTDVSLFRPPSADERITARARLNLPPGTLTVLTVGPVGTASKKRLDHLAREVAQANTSAVLLHVGSDEEGATEVRNAVALALQDRIRWLGRVDRASLRNIMAAADVYSLGSLGEPFSIAILEALASGLPVVHHHDPVMTWQCGNGGIPVAMTEIGSAAAAFRQIASDTARWQSLSRAARQLAVERYSPEPVCAALLHHLRRIAANPPRA
jgi:glycosyltransferase involved in cell wall biosynthesis